MKAWFEQELQLSYGNLLRLAKLMLANNQVNSKTGTYPAAKLEFYFENKRLPAPYFPFLIVTPNGKNLRNKILRNYQKLNGIRLAIGPIRGEKEAGEEGKLSEVMGNRI